MIEDIGTLYRLYLNIITRQLPKNSAAYAEKEDSSPYFYDEQ